MIKVEGLNYTYQGSSVKAVNGISFHIEKGEIFGFLGPSGAGKSTTQKILIRLLDGYEGQAEMFGKDLKTFGSELYENIGVGFELPNHFLKLSAFDNLKFFQSLYNKKTRDIDGLLESVGLLEHKNTKVENFSKGMKMRLNFLRALINEPDIIFLDEPTSGLDPVNAKKIIDIALKEKDKGKTIFLTTHNMKVADDLCDRVAFMVDGNITELDTPKALKLKHGERKLKLEYRDNHEIVTKIFDLDTFGKDEEFYKLVRHHEVHTLHSQETTLEDVFIKVTGRRLN